MATLEAATPNTQNPDSDQPEVQNLQENQDLETSAGTPLLNSAPVQTLKKELSSKFFDQAFIIYFALFIPSFSLINFIAVLVLDFAWLLGHYFEAEPKLLQKILIVGMNILAFIQVGLIILFLGNFLCQSPIGLALKVQARVHSQSTVCDYEVFNIIKIPLSLYIPK